MSTDDVDRLRQQLRDMRCANKLRLEQKISELSKIGDELSLVNSDIEVTEAEERKWKRKYERASVAAGTEAHVIPVTPVVGGSPSSLSGGSVKVREKNLLENILSSLLEFNEPLSKKR